MESISSDRNSSLPHLPSDQVTWAWPLTLRTVNPTSCQSMAAVGAGVDIEWPPLMSFPDVAILACLSLF